MIRCLSFERDMVDGRLANPRLVTGGMACVVGSSRMDIVIVPSRTCTRKKTSRPETSFELLKAPSRKPLRGVLRHARLGEENAKDLAATDRQCFSSERTGSLEESQRIAELRREGGAVGELWAVR